MGHGQEADRCSITQAWEVRIVMNMSCWYKYCSALTSVRDF
jgi:hypothetical protein